MIFASVFAVVFLTSGIFRLLPPKLFFTPKFFPFQKKENIPIPPDISRIFASFTAVFSFLSFSVFAVFGRDFLMILPDFFQNRLREICTVFLVFSALEKIIFALRRPALPTPQNGFLSFFSFLSAAFFIVLATTNHSPSSLVWGIALGSVAMFAVIRWGDTIFQEYKESKIWLFEGLSAIPLLVLAERVFST